MSSIVSITSQGQVTIPSKVRKELGIEGQTTAQIQVVDGLIVIRPNADFWSLAGSLKSTIFLTDAELQAARALFAKEWPR